MIAAQTSLRKGCNKAEKLMNRIKKGRKRSIKNSSKRINHQWEVRIGLFRNK